MSQRLMKALSILTDNKRKRLFFGFFTDDKNDTIEARRLSFKVYERENGKYLCAAPEINLFDLSNILLPFRFNKEDVWRIWSNLENKSKELVEKVSKRYGVQIAIYKGPYRKCQFRISCAIKESIQNIRDHVLELALDRPVDSGRTWHGPGLIDNQPLDSSGIATQQILSKLRYAYGTICRPGTEHNFLVYTINKIVAHRVWEDIYNLANNKTIIFNLHDGLPYALGYCTSLDDKPLNIAFVELHGGGDPYEQFRRENTNIDEWEFPKMIPEGGLVIDRSITGTTLDLLKVRVQASLSVALFPKSRSAIKRASYIVFNGYVFQVNDEWLDEEWYLDKASETLERWRYTNGQGGC